MSTPGSVLTMFAPDGTTGDIPTERVQDATRAGFKVAVPMTSADGKPGFVPFERVGEAQKAGFKTAYPPATAGPAAYGFTPSNLAAKGYQGVKQLAGGLYGMGKDVLFPQGQTEGQKLSFLANKYVFNPADAENARAQTAATPTESIGHSIAAALPFFGPWAATLGEQAGTGDVGGAAANAVAQIAAIKGVRPLAGAAKEGIGTLRDAARDAAFQDLPAKGPQLVKGAARIGRAGGTLAGGALGSATGIPGAGYGGGVAGFELGPSILERILGTPEPGSIKNPGPFSKLPARVKSPAAAPTPEAPLGSPDNPGWYAKLPTRMPKQIAAPPPQLPFLPGAMASNIPVGDAALPEPLQGNPTPFPTVQPKAQVTGGAQEPFEPAVFESPEEAAAHDMRMKNLQRQAKAAGTYHAAQGAAGKKTNLQQRIQKKDSAFYGDE